MSGGGSAVIFGGAAAGTRLEAGVGSSGQDAGEHRGGLDGSVMPFVSHMAQAAGGKCSQVSNGKVT